MNVFSAEPAIILVEPAPPIHTQGGKISLTCVAYGEPEVPTIIWSAPSLGVADFRNGSPDSSINTTIYTSLWNDSETGLVFVISILELCNVNYTYSFVDDFSCQATNGITEEESSVGQRNYSSPFTMRPLGESHNHMSPIKWTDVCILIRISSSAFQLPQL